MFRLLGLIFSSWFLLLACANTEMRQKPSDPARAQAPGQLIPLEDFFRNPVIADFQISADGRWLSYRKAYQGRMNLFIRRPQDPESQEKRMTGFLDRDIQSYFWKGSQYLVVLKDQGGDENFQVFVVDIMTGKVKSSTPFPKVRAQIIDRLELVDEENILLGLNKRDAKIFDIYRLHLPTNQLTMIEKNPGTMTSWLTDHKGRIRWATSTDGANRTYYYRRTDKINFQKVFTLNFKESLHGLEFTPDNERLYALSNLGRDKLSLVEFDPRTRKEISILYQHPQYDLAGIEYSPKRQLLQSVSYTSWRQQRVFFDLEREKIEQLIQEHLPDSEFEISSMTRAEDQMILTSYNDRNPASFYLYRVKGNQLIHLGDSRPWLKANELSRLHNIEFKSRDGLEIQGYIMFPPGTDSNTAKIPLVVNPHGGPWARNHWSFNGEAQFLANRGYAVLMVNFRGSTGFGKKFWTSSFKQWGQTMQNDITDAVHFAIDRYNIDPKRVCIYGGSYGGYATLAGLAFTPDLYRCGIDYVGVSNLFTLLSSIPPYWEPMRAMLYEMIGDPEKDKNLLTRVSPLFHAQNIKAPLFVVQGANDPRVKKAESDQIVEALRKRGVDVPYLVKDNEGHGFRLEENRLEFYREMEKFLKRHL